MLARRVFTFIRPAFNTVRPFSSIANRHVAKVFDKELESEHKNYKHYDWSKLKLKTGFEIAELDYGTLVTLKKKTDEVEIEITFHAKAPPAYLTKKPEEKKEGNENKQEETDKGSYIDFQILVKNPNINRGLIFECTLLDQELLIHRVLHSEDLNNAIRESYGRRMADYRGPIFSKIHNKSQEVFMEYLVKLGLNKEMCVFIEAISWDKEQRLYMEWLRNVKNFVS